MPSEDDGISDECDEEFEVERIPSGENPQHSIVVHGSGDIFITLQTANTDENVSGLASHLTYLVCVLQLCARGTPLERARSMAESAMDMEVRGA